MLGNHAAKLLDILRILHYFKFLQYTGECLPEVRIKCPSRTAPDFRNISSAFMPNPHLKFNLSFSAAGTAKPLPVSGG